MSSERCACVTCYYHFIPFVSVLNLHFSNYYVLSCAYAREPPFNHFDLTFSCILAQPSELPFFSGMTIEQGEMRADPI